MPDEKLTKNQRREAAREVARIEREKQKKRETRNRILFRGGSTLAILAILAIVAIVIYSSTRPAGPGPANMASDGIVLTGSADGIEVASTDGIPEGGTPTATDTASLDRDVNIELYIDYLCPFCNQFETANGEQITQWVESGIASVEIHPIAILDSKSAGTRYSSRAANAAACVAVYDPTKFLDVNAAFYAADGVEEGTANLTNAQIIDVMRGAGVADDKVDTCVNSETYKGWVTSATQRAVGNTDLQDENGSFGTPRIIVNGAFYTGALDDAQAFSAFVQQAAAAGTSDSGTDDSATPSPSPTPTAPTP